MYIKKTPYKKTRHPIFFYFIKNMPKYDYSYCFIPQDDGTLAQAMQRMKERVRWTRARMAILRDKLIKIGNAQQTDPLIIFNKTWTVWDQHRIETEKKLRNRISKH